MSSTEEHFAVFEEDDDFEEFQVEDWDTTTMQQSVDVKLWQDSWDDDTVLDPDFSLQLRAELDKVRQ